MPPAPAAPPAPKPTFSFTPPATARPGSADITFAIVAPQWVGSLTTQIAMLQVGVTPDDAPAFFQDFTSALKDDFLALLTARGFTARGPFASYQEMVFPDKQGSDLVLVPQMDLQLRFQKLTGAGNPLPLIGYFAVDGTATIQGRVTLLVTESLTNERMWTKTIAVQPVTVQWLGTTRFPLEDESGNALSNNSQVWPALALRDQGFQAAVGPKLETIYRAILTTAWDYLDPREMAIVQRQAAAIKKRKAY